MSCSRDKTFRPLEEHTLLGQEAKGNSSKKFGCFDPYVPQHYRMCGTPKDYNKDFEKLIIVDSSQLTLLLLREDCTIVEIHGKKYKSLRFLLTTEDKLLFGAEGLPWRGDHIPTHWQLTQPKQYFLDRQTLSKQASLNWPRTLAEYARSDSCLSHSAGNLFFDQNNSLAMIDNKSGDFRPRFNSLQLVLKKIAVDRHIVMAESVTINELNPQGVFIASYTIQSKAIIEADSSASQKESETAVIPAISVLDISLAPHSPRIEIPNKITEKKEQGNTPHHKKKLEQATSHPNQERIEPEKLHCFKQAIDCIHSESEAFKKLQALYDAIIEEEENLNASAAQYNIIIEHFTEEARQYAEKLQRSPSAIEQSMRTLNLKLYGKPPISQKVKAAIFAVIGALLGCVIGGVIGAIATGGFGGFPGAILGATTGFKIGMGAGLGAGLAGGGITGAYSARQNNFLFTSKEATLSPTIKKKINELSTINRKLG